MICSDLLIPIAGRTYSKDECIFGFAQNFEHDGVPNKMEVAFACLTRHDASEMNISQVSTLRAESKTFFDPREHICHIFIIIHIRSSTPEFIRI